MGNNHGNFELHRFTRRENTAKSFRGGATFFDSHCRITSCFVLEAPGYIGLLLLFFLCVFIFILFIYLFYYYYYYYYYYYSAISIAPRSPDAANALAASDGSELDDSSTSADVCSQTSVKWWNYQLVVRVYDMFSHFDNEERDRENR